MYHISNCKHFKSSSLFNWHIKVTVIFWLTNNKYTGGTERVVVAVGAEGGVVGIVGVVGLWVWYTWV